MAKHPTTPSTAAAKDSDERIVTVEELTRLLSLDRSTIWKLERANRFPRRLQLTPARVGWRLSSIRKWLRKCEDHPVEARQYFGRCRRKSAKAKRRRVTEGEA
jgi:predicted DNA-binding transcriptional regulator AlpA